jgi:hypothetical protein
MAGVGPSVFFFADQAGIAPQGGIAGDEAFGPVAGSETTKFRVTSLHQGMSGTNPAAYAVCKGRVRVQADDLDSTLLTLVLAPDVELLRGVPTQFFVYRGIRRDSLIADGKVCSGTALADRLLKQTDNPDALGLAFRRAAGTPPQPSAAFAREDGNSIDSIFFENTDLKPIPVAAGDTLGEFAAAGFGFEIMLRSLWKPPTLKLLRKVSLAAKKGNLIEIPAGTGAPQARAIREQVYAYLDPCAFYGMCFDFPDGVQYVSAGTAGAAKDAQEIHDGLLSGFDNRNRVYLDLRNENGLSYNYYDTYGMGQVQLAVDQTALQGSELGAAAVEPFATNGWPLKIVAAFPVPPGATKAGIRLAMDSGNLTGAMQRGLFFEHARLFFNPDGSTKANQLVEPAGSSRLLEVTSQPPGKVWTRDVVLGIPAVSTAAGDNVPLAFCTRLRYLRENETRPATASRYVNTGDQWDNLFVVDSDVGRWKTPALSQWWLTGHVKEVRPRLDNQQVYSGMVECGVAVDRDPKTFAPARYTFYYVPVHVEPFPPQYGVISGPNVAGTSGGPGSAGSFFQRKESGQLYDGGGQLTLLKVTEYKGGNPDPLKNAPLDPAPDPKFLLHFLTFLENPEITDPKDPVYNRTHSKESLYALSFAAAEYDRVLSAVVAKKFDRDLHPVFLQVSRRLSPRNDETATERAYQALELRIAGFDSAGKYLAHDVPPGGSAGVQPLSLAADGLIFCTNDAARFEPLDVNWNYCQICTQFRHQDMAGAQHEEEHASDFLYFGRAIADIKSHHPQFYKTMQSLQLLGVEVILHDRPQKKLRRRYQIRATFDPTLIAAAGRTKATAYYNAPFPGFGTTLSNSGFRVVGLTTHPTVDDPALVKYGGLNTSRYADLNRQRKLNGSKVNELFLADYTRAEIAAGGAFTTAKLYLESKWNPGGSGAGAFRQITLAELKDLGFGTLDPRQPVTIRLSRSQLTAKPEEYSYPRPGDPMPVVVKNYNPRRRVITETLAHELGHAQGILADQLVDWIWDQLENYFTGPVFTVETIDTLTILEKKNPAISYKFSNVKLLANYPNPKKDPKDPSSDYQIAKALSKEDNNALHATGFLAKTGAGHLRGAPTAKAACDVERVISEVQLSIANREIAALIPPQRDALGNIKRDVLGQPLAQWSGRIRLAVDYCFLNIDDADLNAPP